MNQRVLPEWSKDKLEYVEPTQVVRSFGYDVFANEVSEETLKHNEQTIAKILEVDGEVAGYIRAAGYPARTHSLGPAG